MIITLIIIVAGLICMGFLYLALRNLRGLEKKTSYISELREELRKQAEQRKASSSGYDTPLVKKKKYKTPQISEIPRKRSQEIGEAYDALHGTNPTTDLFREVAETVSHSPSLASHSEPSPSYSDHSPSHDHSGSSHTSHDHSTSFDFGGTSGDYGGGSDGI